jgi:hypothetical protein
MKCPFTNRFSHSEKGQKFMKKPNMRKSFAAMIVISLALGASLAYGLMSGHSVKAKSAHNQPNMPAAASSSMTLAAAQTTGVIIPRTPIYALNSNNVIFVLWPGATSFTRLVRVTQANGNLIGIDFRPADGKNTALYALTDTGTIYTITLTPNGLGNATQVSNLSPRFPSGIQSLMDFNPVVNALRLIGSDRLNYAAVNSNGNLNVTAIQTALSYDPNDVNRGVAPHISAGSYDTNFAGVAATRFYAIDYDLDTLVTIQPATPGGSSATGGGVLQTLGPLVTPTGQRINISSTADFDIYTVPNPFPLAGGGPLSNRVVGVSGQTLFTMDFTLLNPAVPAGTVTNIVTQSITMPNDTNNIIDVAVSSDRYEAENATVGGGARVDTSFPGFSGTGYVSLGSGVAGGFVEFQVNQSDPSGNSRAYFVTYANGSNVNRPCITTVNGVVVDSFDFPPTGSWSNYNIVLRTINLGAAPGFRNVRITSTTAAGGPSIDSTRFGIQ